MLDAALSSWGPTHTFTAQWSEGVALARRENGGGDNYAIVFEPAGVFLYGFDHESQASPWRDEDREHWPGLLDGTPAALERWTREPLFLFLDFFDATVCAWRETADTEWHCGPVEFESGSVDPDGAENLFGMLLDGSVAAFAEFAEHEFGRQVDSAAIAAVLATEPLSEDLVLRLNPEARYPAIAKIARATGYPVATAA